MNVHHRDVLRNIRLLDLCALILDHCCEFIVFGWMNRTLSHFAFHSCTVTTEGGNPRTDATISCYPTDLRRTFRVSILFSQVPHKRGERPQVPPSFLIVVPIFVVTEWLCEAKEQN